MSGEAAYNAKLAEVLAQSTIDGLVAVNSAGKILFFNAAAGRIFGADPEKIVGQSLDQLFPAGMFVEHQHYLRDYFSGKGRGIVDAITVEAEIRNRLGQRVPIEINLSSAILEGERLVLASIRNISRRQEADRRTRTMFEQLTQAQKMETLGTLAAGIAHDINNMLGAIMGYATAMAAEADQASPHSHDTLQIVEIVRRAKTLTEHILTFSRHSEFTSEPLSVSALVRQTSTLLSRTLPKNIVIKTKLTRDLTVEGDRGQLEQALLNLCLNARDAMPDGGTLQIMSTRVELSPALAGNLELAPGCYSLISVKDDGMGIEADTLRRVFDPFFTTKPKGEGSGLGLSLVSATIQNHGGQIRITSEPGKGTEVRLYLPASDATLPLESIPTPLPRIQSQGETILLVDDERHLRSMAKRLLEGLGYGVLLAECGEEAVEIYRQMKDRISLVILDVIMAGLSGVETLERLREVNKHVKVLVSSGYNERGAPRELLSQGVCGFIQKPYGIEEISEAIRLALG